MTTKLNPVIQRDILDQDYVSRRDLSDLYGWSKRQAAKEFDRILEDQLSQGENIMCRGRTALIPLNRILSKYPLSYQKIDRSAKRVLKEENR